MFGKAVAGIAGGLIVAALAGNIVNLAFGSKAAGGGALLLSWAAAVFGAGKAPRAAKAWRWLLVTSGALSFVVPLAALLYTARETTGAEAVGGLVATGLFGVVFFLLGAAFLVIGLLIGRDTRGVGAEKR